MRHEIRIICFAAGGHAAVVLDALQAMDRQATFCGFVDKFKAVGDQICGYPVVGGDDDRDAVCKAVSPTHYFIGLGSVRGGAGNRKSLFEKAQSFDLESVEVIHPSAVVSPSAAIGTASVIMAGAIIQPRARIGVNVIVNTRASVDHDCVIGDHSHIAPGATLSGNVTVGEDTLIGVGASVMQGVKIGNGVTVGAGAVVVRDIPDGSTVYGVPAR